MIDTLYVEEQLLQHPRVAALRSRFPRARLIECGRYGEILNRKAQNFRLQKQRPALLLARKHERRVLPAPAGYSIGGGHNYYFSHMLNCVYDCRYCFLQGMYRSAHYVLFVNYEDFASDLAAVCARHPGQPVYFFSGYDCDSLALEPVSGFCEYFLPQFAALDNAWLELRTKSTQVRHLLERAPLPRVVVAFSFTPLEIAAAVEHKTPALERRIEAMRKLQAAGWPLGLRFDPLIHADGYQNMYRELFAMLAGQLRWDQLHSVSCGVFRMPQNYFHNTQRLYPREPLFATASLRHGENMVAYQPELAQEMMDFCQAELSQYVAADRLFTCRY